MQRRPDRFVRRKRDDTHSIVSVVAADLRGDEHQLIGTDGENSHRSSGDDSSSYVRFLQPLPTDEQSDIHALDGHQGAQPVGEPSGGGE